MKHVLSLIFIFSVHANARTKVDVSSIQNQTSSGGCSAAVHWKGDLDDSFRHEIINSLNETNAFTIVEPEQLRAEKPAKLFDSGVSTVHRTSTFKAAQFSISGKIKSFDICDKQAKVVVEIQVLDVKSGKVAHQFESKGLVSTNGYKDESFKGAGFNTGLFRDSPIGRATSTVISDITSRLRKAFPDRDVASDVQVRTIRKRSR